MHQLQSRVRPAIHLGHDDFFRGRLLILDAESIAQDIENMEKEANAVRADCLKVCWYMRGGVTYTEAMMLSPKERELIGTLVKENLETTKKSGLPFF